MTAHNDILNNNKGELTEAQLAAYIEGTLSIEEQREVELLLSEEGVESDALEGLMSLGKDDAKVLANRVNYKLQIEVKQQKYRNKKLFQDRRWTLVAVCVVILLAVLGYYVIILMTGGQ